MGDEEQAATIIVATVSETMILRLRMLGTPVITPNHLPVERYVTPGEFDAYRQEGLEMGFLEVVAGPMVRSSYRAEQVLQKNNVGIAV